MKTQAISGLRLAALSLSLSLLTTIGWTADPVAPPDGNTSLHRAVLRGDAVAVERLLSHGADAKATNTAGATALHYAVGNERMVTALLAHGAPVNALSKLGNTPLTCAVARPDSFAASRRLIEAGADARLGGALIKAIISRDRRTVELLLDHGADANPAEGVLPILVAASGGDAGIAELLLARGAQANNRDPAKQTQPLTIALFNSRYDAARLLIEQGANVNVRAPLSNVAPTTLIMSAYNDARDPAIVRLLVERGADVRGTDDYGQTALSYALKRGADSPVVAFLREARTPEPKLPRRAKEIPSREVPTDPTERQAMLRASVQRAIDLVQHSSKVFLETPRVRDQSKCTSCHHQDLPSMAMGLAAERGLRIDMVESGRALRATVTQMRDHVEEVRQTGPVLPLNSLVIGHRFDGLHAQRFAPDAVTDALSRALLDFQRPDGSWIAPTRRPPMEDGELVATAWGARALQLYPPAGRARDVRHALQRTRAYLSEQKLRDLNDRVFQLMGLAWSGETPRRLKPFTEKLLALQNADGSWSQFPSLKGDAWATGSALVALHKAGVPTSHVAYVRGVTFLLRTQFDDGSWWVPTRSLPTQVYFDGGFPHGRDQWISAAGTSWAMIALLESIKPTVPPSRIADARQIIAAFETSSSASRRSETARSDTPSVASDAIPTFARDIQPLFKRSCVKCHSGADPKGLLDLTTRDGVLAGGQSGDPAVVPGSPSESHVIRYVSDMVEDLEMPPLRRREKNPALSPEEIDRVREWIEAGAP
jgi:ankyrin repeat protein